MRIGILGSGLMGAKLGTLFARAGHDVVFSYARSERKLKRLAREARGNARAGTPSDAARDADALLLAVHWSRVDDVLKQAGVLSGKVIVTCSLPMSSSDTKLVIAHTSSGAEALAKKARRAHVVSAFGTVPSEVLFGVFQARRKVNRPSLVYCGDDRGANQGGRFGAVNVFEHLFCDGLAFGFEVGDLPSYHAVDRACGGGDFGEHGYTAFGVDWG